MQIVKRLVVLTAVLAVTLAAAPAVSATSPRATTPRPGKYAIGDSVMLGAKNELKARGFHVNAVVSRRFDDAPSILRPLVASGKLPRKVVIHLGNQGYVTAHLCNTVMRIVGGKRHVWFVTLKVPRSYRKANNRQLQACVSRHGNASLIGWYAFSHRHGSWFYPDGYHLTPTGQSMYAGLVGRAI